MSNPVSIVVPRLESKPWGGRDLARFGVDLPADESIGEAIMTSGDVTISGGYGAGRELGALIEDDPDQHLGRQAPEVLGGRSLFPLLVKLIDAGGNLSIQVHPDDAGAATYDSPGKTEAWHVLAAKPGARLFVGLRPGVELDAFMAAAGTRDGSTASLMRTIPAVTGTTILLPAGTIHALGAGVIVCEIQQPSDLTFRLDDWGRTDAQGDSRELHPEQGRAAARLAQRPELIRPVRRRVAIGERHILTACRYFALERIALPAGGTVPIDSRDSPVVVTVVGGSADLGNHVLGAGMSGVIWPLRDEATTLCATAPTVALVGWVPDLLKEVIAPGRSSGAADDVIAALSGPLDDVGGLLGGAARGDAFCPSPDQDGSAAGAASPEGDRGGAASRR